MGAKEIVLIGCAVNAFGAAGGGGPWSAPTDNLMLDFDADAIPDADGANITAAANQAPGNDFASINDTPTVHDGEIEGHRVARFGGNGYIVYTADNSHSDAASVYTVAKYTNSGNVNRAVIVLFTHNTERNVFLHRHAATHLGQAFWNAETGWEEADQLQPDIDPNDLVTRGWTIATQSMTTVDLKFYGEDGGTPVEEIHPSQTPNGMEEFASYRIGTDMSTGGWIGDIARVLVYDVTHTAGEAAAIVAGLRAEYGSI